MSIPSTMKVEVASSRGVRSYIPTFPARGVLELSECKT